MFRGEDLVKSHRFRANAIANIILVAFSVILARLWYLQIYKGKTLYEYSLKNRLRQEIVRAPRGMMFSRNHYMMVDNIPRFDAVLTPQYLKNKEQTIKSLANILDMTVEAIQKIIEKNSTLARYKPIIIKKNISWEEVSLIETENSDLPGISVETFISREYTDQEVGAHLLGYISEISQSQLPKYNNKNKKNNYRLGDFVGQFGIEEKFDPILRGKNGYEFVEVDARGRKKRHISNDDFFEEMKNRPSLPGHNLKLTIDRDLQVSAFNALEGKVGAAVALDVTSGEVLAMVSRPSFNPSAFSKGLTNEYWLSLIQNPFNPLRDRTIQEHYSPGSTFKLITAIAALEEGIVDARTEVNCNGKFRLGQRVFHCWKKFGHGGVDVYKAIRESCDVYFYKIATKLDIDTLAKYARAYGFGEKTGISLPREVKGLIPTKAWKKERTGRDWALGETLSCVIGQSYILATPLQLALAYSAMANGGKLYRPYFIKEVFTNSGETLKKYSPQLMGTVQLKPENLEIIQKGLFQVANHPRGTAWWKRGQGNAMAGKTGTSQVVRFSADKIYSKCEDIEYKYRHHGLFVAYAPYHNPKIVVSAVVEHGCSSSAAIPVVAEIITSYLKKYEPKIYEQNIEEEKKQLNDYYVQIKKEKEKESTDGHGSDGHGPEPAH